MQINKSFATSFSDFQLHIIKNFTKQLHTLFLVMTHFYSGLRSISCLCFPIFVNDVDCSTPQCHGNVWYATNSLYHARYISLPPPPSMRMFTCYRYCIIIINRNSVWMVHNICKGLSDTLWVAVRVLEIRNHKLTHITAPFFCSNHLVVHGHQSRQQDRAEQEIFAISPQFLQGEKRRDHFDSRGKLAPEFLTRFVMRRGRNAPWARPPAAHRCSRWMRTITGTLDIPGARVPWCLSSGENSHFALGQPVTYTGHSRSSKTFNRSPIAPWAPGLRPDLCSC